MVNISLRSVLFGTSAALFAGVSPSRAKPVLTDDGYYTEPWFIESFLELADDHAAAKAKGKHFAVMWELKGCPYCKETHMVNFARQDISDYVQKNFDILALNVIGSRTVTDVDGEELSEKQLAAKYGVKFTPTIQFFPTSLDGIKDVAPAQREVIRIPGYLRPDDFLDVFRFVEQRDNGAKTFREFLKSRSG
jgi:thioredoxin-related protein